MKCYLMPNDTVTVQLTEEGEHALKKYEEFSGYTEGKRLDNGKIEFLLWNFMQVFGWYYATQRASGSYFDEIVI